jgi:hypothetical protein
MLDRSMKLEGDLQSAIPWKKIHGGSFLQTHKSHAGRGEISGCETPRE